ncbi:MAG TPA: hypothetical protein VFN31_02645 [Candidatus Saccharimonadales bacterium]|nr:hypothetical protein [Candidatus Saccharimonadales bacterium]
MIDSQARNEARAICNGEQLRPDTPAKVAYYGLAARTLNPDYLPEFLLLGPDDMLGFNRLGQLLECTLREAAHSGYAELDSLTRKQALDAYASHRPEAQQSPLGLEGSAYNRLRSGCGTATMIEMITLRTIARQQDKGNRISYEGLKSSARVPLKIAMMHLSDLCISKLPEEPSTWDYYGYWHAPNANDSGLVFRDDDITLDRQNGLRITNLHDQLASDIEKSANGPQIGCPAMLIKGYVNKLHTIAADAAVTCGLIVPV